MKLPPYVKAKASGYYFEPSKRVAELGFKSEALGKDPLAAFQRARSLNEQIAAALKTGEPTAQIKPGTVSEMIYLYRQDAAYTELAAKTRRGYDQCIERVEKWAGNLPAAAITRKAVKAWYRKMANGTKATRGVAEVKGTPAYAAATIRVLSIIMGVAIDEGLRLVNPAKKMRLRGGGGTTEHWPTGALTAFCTAALKEGRHSIALAAQLAWHFGQREGDILAMARGQFDATHVTIRQRKTGKPLRIPTPPALRLWIEGAPKVSPTLVISESTGRPYKEDHFRHEFSRIRDLAKLSAGLKFMGLRHSAAQQLGEAGCTEEEIRSITGHRSDAMRRYVRPSSVLADRAMAKRQENDEGKPRE